MLKTALKVFGFHDRHDLCLSAYLCQGPKKDQLPLPSPCVWVQREERIISKDAVEVITEVIHTSLLALPYLSQKGLQCLLRIY